MDGLAAMYGNGEGNTVTHYYAGRPDTAPKKKHKSQMKGDTKMACKKGKDKSGTGKK